MAALAALSATPAAAAADLPSAVRELQLPAGLLASVPERARRAQEEARWLEELPLDDVAPGFVFPAE
jgi:hypothetical protein